MNLLAPARIALLLLLVGCTSTDHAPLSEGANRLFLWEVGTASPTYLFGTIHRRDERVNQIPDAVRVRLAASDLLLTEIVIDSAAIESVLAARSLPDGQSLSDVVPGKTLDRARRFLSNIGHSIDPYLQRKVWSLRSQLGQLEDRSDPTATFLDQAIMEAAERFGMRHEALESVSDQLKLLQSFSPEEQIELLESELQTFETLANQGRSYGQTLIADYASGEDARVARHIEYAPAVRHVSDALRREFVRRIFYSRNEAMARELTRRLSASPNESRFVAIGVGHLVGKNSVISHLRAAGLTVERMSQYDPVRVEEAAAILSRALGQP